MKIKFKINIIKIIEIKIILMIRVVLRYVLCFFKILTNVQKSVTNEKIFDERTKNGDERKRYPTIVVFFDYSFSSNFNRISFEFVKALSVGSIGL